MPGTTPRGYPFPLYTESANFPTQMQSLALAVDTDVQNNLVTAVNNGLNQPSVLASSSVVQSIANLTDVNLNFTVESYDNANWFNSGVSQTNFTAPSTGFYMMRLSVSYASNATGARTAIVKINGNFIWGKTLTGVSYDITQVMTVHMHQLTAGDIVTFVARQNSGVALNCTNRIASINKISA